MPTMQFSIRGIMYVTLLAAVTLWLARHLIVLAGRHDLGSQFTIMLTAAALGPAGFATLGFLAGREANTPWRASFACLLVAVLGWSVFLVFRT